MKRFLSRLILPTMFAISLSHSSRADQTEIELPFIGLSRLSDCKRDQDSDDTVSCKALSDAWEAYVTYTKKSDSRYKITINAVKKGHLRLQQHKEEVTEIPQEILDMLKN